MSRFKIMKYVGSGNGVEVYGNKPEIVAVKDTQFNIWAFLFGLLYMLYKKMYIYALGIFVILLVISAIINDPNVVSVLGLAFSIGLAILMTPIETYWYEQQGYTHIATVEAQDYATAIMQYKEANKNENNTTNETSSSNANTQQATTYTNKQN